MAKSEYLYGYADSVDGQYLEVVGFEDAATLRIYGAGKFSSRRVVVVPREEVVALIPALASWAHTTDQIGQTP